MANMELNREEITDVKRALIIAMHELDATKNGPDIVLSDRLEAFKIRLEEIDSFDN